MTEYIGTKRYRTVNCRLTLSTVAAQNKGTINFECQWPPTNADLAYFHQIALQNLLIPGLYLNNIDIQQLAGERASLTYTYTSDDQAINGSASGMAAEEPRYSMRASCMQEPLLSYRKLREISSVVRECLKALMEGATMGSKIKTSEGEKKIGDVIKNDSVAQKAAELIMKGVNVVYTPTLVWQERTSAKSMAGVSVVGLGRIASPPGGAPSGGSRNYLFSNVEADTDTSGKRVDIVKTYELSGEGGWDSWLYN